MNYLNGFFTIILAFSVNTPVVFADDSINFENEAKFVIENTNRYGCVKDCSKRLDTKIENCELKISNKKELYGHLNDNFSYTLSFTDLNLDVQQTRVTDKAIILVTNGNSIRLVSHEGGMGSISMGRGSGARLKKMFIKFKDKEMAKRVFEEILFIAKSCGATQ